jgi:hypothetical protein
MLVFRMNDCANLFSQKMVLGGELQKAKEEAARYKKQLEEQRPLAEVGERVRSRFLEQERLTYFPHMVTREQLDQEKLEQGNEAAHGGNGVADAALIVAMGKKGLETEDYKYLFYEMYGRDLDHYIAVTQGAPQIVRALDLRASIRAGQGMHGGLGTQQQRNEAMDLFNEVVQTGIVYETLERQGFAESAALLNGSIDSLLRRLEDAKADLVKTYNQRRNNRRGARRIQESAPQEGSNDVDGWEVPDRFW